jgi:hypothetical protein
LRFEKLTIAAKQFKRVENSTAGDELKSFSPWGWQKRDIAG